MPIPATTSVTESINFDTLLVRTLVYTGGNFFTLQLCRYASDNGLVQPASIATHKVTEATVNAALQSLITQFMTARNITGTNIRLVINGSVNVSTVRGSMHLTVDDSAITIQDCYAEAARDPVFGQILVEFLSAISTYNQTAKVI